MDKVDGIVALLVIVLVVPLLVGITFVALIGGAYLTVIVSAWLFGAHVDWSIIDILNLPYSEVVVIVQENILLYILMLCTFFLIFLVNSPSKKD